VATKRLNATEARWKIILNGRIQIIFQHHGKDWGSQVWWKSDLTKRAYKQSVDLQRKAKKITRTSLCIYRQKRVGVRENEKERERYSTRRLRTRKEPTGYVDTINTVHNKPQAQEASTT
jgi:hypothetical protein